MQIQIAKIRPILSQEVLRIRDKPIVQVRHILLDRVLHHPEVRLQAITGLQATLAQVTVNHQEALQVHHMEEVAQVVVRPVAAHQAEVLVEVLVEVAQAVLVTEDSAEPQKMETDFNKQQIQKT